MTILSYFCIASGHQIKASPVGTTKDMHLGSMKKWDEAAKGRWTSLPGRSAGVFLQL